MMKIMKITKRQLRRLIKEELVREASQPTGGVRIGDTVWMRDGSHPLKGRVSAKHKDPRMGHIISVVWYNDNNEMAGQSRHIPSALTTNQTGQKSAEEAEDDLSMLIRALHAQRSGDI